MDGVTWTLPDSSGTIALVGDAPTAHTHVSADITDASEANGSSTIVRRSSEGDAAFSTVSTNLSGTSTLTLGGGNALSSTTDGTLDWTLSSAASGTSRFYILPDASGNVLLDSTLVPQLGLLSGTVTASGAWAFSSPTRPTSAGTGTPAANSLITRADADSLATDFGAIILRDDFIGGIDGDSNIGQLRWYRVDANGAGTFRPSNLVPGFGVAGLHTSALFRGNQFLYWDASNANGNFGFFLSSIENDTTRITHRTQFSSLNSRIDLGFGTSQQSQNATVRKFVLNYTQIPTAWTANQVVAAGEIRRPTTPNGRRYLASAGGTTGATQPTWPTAYGGSIVDGTVTWQEYGNGGHANWRIFFHTVVNEVAGVIIDTGIPAVANTWLVVDMTYQSGQWVFTINGTQINTGISSVPAANYSPIFCIENTINATCNLSIDYWGMNTRITRP